MRNSKVLFILALMGSVLSLAAPAAAEAETAEEAAFPVNLEEQVFVALPEGAEGLTPTADIYAWDPLGLVAGDDVRKYTSGTDLWEVWICETPQGDQPVSVSGAVAYLNANVTPYYDFLSEGDYRIVFQAGGMVAAGDPNACLTAAGAASAGGVNAALVIADVVTGFGFGGPGFTCPASVCGNQGPTAYPGNYREVFVGAEAVVDVGIFGEPLESLPTHEMGHALHWSHSYTGNETLGGSQVWEYDNPIDVMSGNTSTLGQPSSEPDSYGTHALNRYAAGWIDASDVYVHNGGTTEFVLGATGSSTTELAVVPFSAQGHFVAIDSRITSAQDTIPAAWQGVSLHEIDQRPDGTCFSNAYGACIGAERRVKQATEEPFTIDHVLTPGESVTVGGVQIDVLALEGNGYRVRFSGSPTGVARFTDTATSVFEEDIDWLANTGITRGCNPPSNTMFCPDDRVTRGQMAAFLVRALGLTDVGAETFGDTVGHVFEVDIDRLAQAGITRGCGTGRFCPDDPVTRGQMAAFLTRAFALTDGSGVSFSDTVGNEFAEDIARLAKAGITKGCNPPGNTLFCPNDSVTRGQMAAFLHRSESYLP